MSEIRQAEINIGTAGHVDCGKTTIVKALTGEWADKHSEEIKRGITIRLGYADGNFYKCEKCGINTTSEKCSKKHETKILRKISFVDCPGHENLMTVMLSGSSLMDGVLLVIAANEKCPQAQTEEHLAALEIIGVKNIVIVQNKVDLVSKKEAMENYKEIKKFVKGTIAEKAPIIPVAAPYSLNIDALIEAIQEYIPTPKREVEKNVRLMIARSFDINKPGTKIKDLKGGVVGGLITQGILKEGEDIEISPGLETKKGYKPIITKVTSLSTKEGLLKEAHPGGLVGVGTLLDPSIVKNDRLVGNILGKPGTLPNIKEKILLEFHFLHKRTEEKIIKNDLLVITAGTATSVGSIIMIKKNLIELLLKKPICADKNDKVAISKKIGTRWSLIGYGVIK